MFSCFESQIYKSTFAMKKNEILEIVDIEDKSNLAILPSINSSTENAIKKVTEWNDRKLRHSAEKQSTHTSHFKPGDDAEPNLMGCAGSKLARRILEETKHHNVLNTGPPCINDFLSRVDAKIKEMLPKENRELEPIMIPAGFSLDQLHTVTRRHKQNKPK